MLQPLRPPGFGAWPILDGSYLEPDSVHGVSITFGVGASQVMQSKQYYDWLGREPAVWCSTALELKRAADAVAAQWAQDLDPSTRIHPTVVPPNLGPPYMLLAAFAVENLAKAILIKRDPNLFPLTVPSKGGLRTHDLVELVERVGVTCTGEDQTLLQRLAQFGVWSGRYPVPLAPDELAAWRGHDDTVLRPDGTPEIIKGSTHLPSVVYARDPSEVDRLFTRLFEQLNAELRHETGGAD